MAGAANTAAALPTSRSTTFSHEADWETTPSKTSSPSAPGVIRDSISTSRVPLSGRNLTSFSPYCSVDSKSLKAVNSHHLMAKILRYWLPVAAWVALITFFSTDVFHGGLTRGIVRSVLLFFSPEISQESIELVHLAVRKLAHVFEYFVLTLLLYRGIRRDASNGSPRRWALLSLLVAVGFAGLDEFHQSFESKRLGSLADVGFDAVGVMIAQVLLWLDQRRRARIAR